MLKRIVHPSSILVTFVTLLHLNLSRPQRKHLLRTADAIIVCEWRKTLANLYRQWVEAPDVSAVADFFRVRWQGWHVICALKRNRTLDGIRVDQWDQRLRHKRYTRVRVPAADGTTRTYLVRSVQGRLSDGPFPNTRARRSSAPARRRSRQGASSQSCSGSSRRLC